VPSVTPPTVSHRARLVTVTVFMRSSFTVASGQ